jgi:hypothetical protein
MFDEGPGTKAWTVDVLRGIDENGRYVGPINSTTGQLSYKFESVTAISGSDFTASDGTLSFGVGETKKTISFVIVDDSIPETKEYFKIRLQSPVGDVVFINPNVADVYINANDYANGVLTFKPMSEGSAETPVVRVNEDTYSVAAFTILRTAGTFGQVSVGWYMVRSDNKTDPVAQDVGPLQGKMGFLLVVYTNIPGKML